MNNSVENPELEAALAQAANEMAEGGQEVERVPEQVEVAKEQGTSPEKMIEALETNPEHGKKVKELMGDALGEEMTPDQHGEVNIEIEGVQAMAAALREAPENQGLKEEARDMLQKLLKSRYNLTLEQVLGAMDAGWKTYAMHAVTLDVPGMMGTAAGEMTGWAVGKALDVKPKELGLAETAEVYAKLGSDMLKVLGILIAWIPGVDIGTIPLEGIGFTMDAAGTALEKYNKTGSSYEATKDLTLVVLPKKADGSVDMEATHAMMKEGARKELERRAANGEDPNSNVNVLLRKAQENPEIMTGLMQKLDQLKNDRGSGAIVEEQKGGVSEEALS